MQFLVRPFASKYVYNLYKYFDGGMPIGKCTRLLLLVLPRDCDSFQCWCGSCGLLPAHVVDVMLALVASVNN